MNIVLPNNHCVLAPFIAAKRHYTVAFAKQSSLSNLVQKQIITSNSSGRLVLKDRVKHFSLGVAHSLFPYIALCLEKKFLSKSATVSSPKVSVKSKLPQCKNFKGCTNKLMNSKKSTILDFNSAFERLFDDKDSLKLINKWMEKKQLNKDQAREYFRKKLRGGTCGGQARLLHLFIKKNGPISGQKASSILQSHRETIFYLQMLGSIGKALGHAYNAHIFSSWNYCGKLPTSEFNKKSFGLAIEPYMPTSGEFVVVGELVLEEKGGFHTLFFQFDTQKKLYIIQEANFGVYQYKDFKSFIDALCNPDGFRNKYDKTRTKNVLTFVAAYPLS